MQPVGNIDFLVNVVGVGFYGVDADVEAVGNVLVGGA